MKIAEEKARDFRRERQIDLRAEGSRELAGCLLQERLLSDWVKLECFPIENWFMSDLLNALLIGILEALVEYFGVLRKLLELSQGLVIDSAA